MSRLKDKYLSEVVKGLQEKYNYKNVMELPKVTKVVINMAVGEAVTNSKALDAAVGDMNLGCKVTLRGERMYEFLDKLMNLALPRVRDFHGISATGFDGRGNYTLGLKEQLIFPEIEYDKIDKARGMDITIVTTAKTDEEGRDMLTLMGMPFEKQ